MNTFTEGAITKKKKLKHLRNSFVNPYIEVLKQEKKRFLLHTDKISLGRKQAIGKKKRY